VETNNKNMNINKHELKEVLSGIDTFVSNVGLTTRKLVDMNKYLDFRTSGKANPNPYHEQGILIEQRISNIQTGFDYDEQLIRKWKAEGITPIANEDKKECWFDIVTKTLVVSKSNPNNFYFRYQDHASSYLDTKYIFEGNPIEKVLFEQFVRETKTDYSKYQSGLENTLNFKVMSLNHIKRIKILKQEYTIID
jgi:hypothetical protein